MSGNGMIGGKNSPNYEASLWAAAGFLDRLDSLGKDYLLLGPVGSGNRTVFREVATAFDLNLQGGRTMTPPGKEFFYRSRQDLLQFKVGERISVESVAPAPSNPALLVGIRPCDVHALFYLDKTFGFDPYYQTVRQDTLLVAVNCDQPTPYCFCASVGTGPFFELSEGCDVVLTRLNDEWLLEPLTGKAARLFATGDIVSEKHWQAKAARMQASRDRIVKRIDFNGLESMLLRNKEHPVWSHTAGQRCLSCSNCVMVCPTCFCHDVRDQVDMGFGKAVRYRQWDACQDIHFAEVHGGNFRHTRKARLRQFVLHKLNFTAQYGQPGTVGCGRCIEWCPTAIDLTEIAKEIRRTTGAKQLSAE